MIHVQACSKVNLCLEVLGRRQDSYHEIATVIQAISIYDELELEEAETLSLTCNVPSLEVPDNLVLRAADLLRANTGTTLGASIRLKKVIPMAMGLGGGSSDGAAALLGLNRLWGTGLSSGELMEIGSHLGSDVPFFLGSSGTVLATGRGEQLKPLPSLRPVWMVILVLGTPTSEQKTKALYSMMRPNLFTNGLRTQEWEQNLQQLSTAQDWSQFSQQIDCSNVFEEIACSAFPGLAEAWQAFGEESLRLYQDHGEKSHVHLTGTGPGMFALFKDKRSAATVRDALRRRGFHTMLAQNVDQPLEIEG